MPGEAPQSKVICGTVKDIVVQLVVAVNAAVPWQGIEAPMLVDHVSVPTIRVIDPIADES